MRFMIIRRADEESEAGGLPSPELLAAMTRYNEELLASGVMLDGAGLHPSSSGVRVEFEGGRPTVLDGPFTEAKELVAGYTMVQADSLEEVVELVRRWPVEDGGGNVEIEIRQVAELEDLDMSESLKDRERALRARTEGGRA